MAITANEIPRERKYPGIENRLLSPCATPDKPPETSFGSPKRRAETWKFERETLNPLECGLPQLPVQSGNHVEWNLLRAHRGTFADIRATAEALLVHLVEHVHHAS